MTDTARVGRQNDLWRAVEIYRKQRDQFKIVDLYKSGGGWQKAKNLKALEAIDVGSNTSIIDHKVMAELCADEFQNRWGLTAERLEQDNLKLISHGGGMTLISL